jgi:hemoglobin-like flavoprotein
MYKYISITVSQDLYNIVKINMVQTIKIVLQHVLKQQVLTLDQHFNNGKDLNILVSIEHNNK